MSRLLVSQNLKTDRYKNESANMGEGDVKNQEKNANVIYGWSLAFFLIKDHALSSFLSFYVTNSETGETIRNELK